MSNDQVQANLSNEALLELLEQIRIDKSRSAAALLHANEIAAEAMSQLEAVTADNAVLRACLRETAACLDGILQHFVVPTADRKAESYSKTNQRVGFEANEQAKRAMALLAGAEVLR